MWHFGGLKAALPSLFARRLQEEMGKRKLSANALARILRGRVGYASISRILSGKQDPTLDKVDALAEAVGMPAWALLTEEKNLEQVVIRPPSNVVRLPDPYPKIFDKKPHEQATKRNKRRR